MILKALHYGSKAAWKHASGNWYIWRDTPTEVLEYIESECSGVDELEYDADFEIFLRELRNELLLRRRREAVPQSSGCYPGCYYYTDSCFRKDCKGTNEATKQTKNSSS